jgi:hypothetical protein
MQQMFDVSLQSEITQKDFWTLYKDNFDVYGSDKMMISTELFQLVPTVFAGAKVMAILGDDGKPFRYVIRGLERRRPVAVDTSEPSLLDLNDKNGTEVLFEGQFNQLLIKCKTILEQQALLKADYAQLATELSTAQAQDKGSLPVTYAYLNETVPRMEKAVEAASRKMDVLAKGMSQMAKKVSCLSEQMHEVDVAVREVQQTSRNMSKSGEWLPFALRHD